MKVKVNSFAIFYSVVIFLASISCFFVGIKKSDSNAFIASSVYSLALAVLVISMKFFGDRSHPPKS